MIAKVGKTLSATCQVTDVIHPIGDRVWTDARTGQMMSNQALKNQARAYAAEHDLSYARALQVVTEPARGHFPLKRIGVGIDQPGYERGFLLGVAKGHPVAIIGRDAERVVTEALALHGPIGEERNGVVVRTDASIHAEANTVIDQPVDNLEEIRRERRAVGDVQPAFVIAHAHVFGFDGGPLGSRSARLRQGVADACAMADPSVQYIITSDSEASLPAWVRHAVSGIINLDDMTMTRRGGEWTPKPLAIDKEPVKFTASQRIEVMRDGKRIGTSAGTLAAELNDMTNVRIVPNPVTGVGGTSGAYQER